METTWDRRTFLRNGALVGAGALAGSQLLNPGSANAGTTDLDPFLRRRLRESGSPGMGLAAVHGGHLVWSKGLGLADVQRGRDVQRDTMFMLASVSKTITATALMQVWERGLLDLDGDVNEVLPFLVRNPSFPSRPITVRQLLTHTSSLRDNWSRLVTLYTAGDSSLELGTFLERYLVPGAKYYDAEKNFTRHRSGNFYRYCNVGVALLGLVVEHVTGVPFDRWCERHIFAPLGMRDTGWHLRGLDRDRIARPYRQQGDGGWHSFGLYGYPDYPDGALRTTATSLAKFLAAYARGGGPILKSATVDLMLSDQKLPVGWQGLVWYRSSGPGGHLVGHSGSDSGVRTEMWFRRDDGAGAIVLTNGNSRNSVLREARDRLVREAPHLG